MLKGDFRAWKFGFMGGIYLSLGVRLMSLSPISSLPERPSMRSLLIIHLALFCCLMSSLSCLSTRSAVQEEIMEPPSNTAVESQTDREGYSASIFISSIPPIAEVYMDGVYVGKTNMTKLRVKPGQHAMKFVQGSKVVLMKMYFIEGENRSQLVDLH